MASASRARAARAGWRRVSWPRQGGPRCDHPPAGGGVADMRKGTPSRGRGPTSALPSMVKWPRAASWGRARAGRPRPARRRPAPARPEQVHHLVAVAAPRSTTRPARRARRRGPDPAGQGGEARVVGPRRDGPRPRRALDHSSSVRHEMTTQRVARRLAPAPGQAPPGAPPGDPRRGGCRCGKPGRRAGRPFTDRSSSRAPARAVAGSSWDTSTCWPSPVRRRWASAVRMATAPR